MKTIRKPFDAHERVHPKISPVSMTHQSHKNECDINNIMRKFEKFGVLEHRNNYEGQYGDFTAVPQDYREAMTSVLAAQEMFLELPSKIRRRFGNDPGAFLDFATDPQNGPAMVEMGLAVKRVPEETKTPSEAPKTPPKAKKDDDSPV